MNALLHTTALFLREHLPSISIGMVSVALVIYGNHINAFFRKLTRKFHFWMRYGLFILLCTAGYGLASSQIVKLLKNTLRGLSDIQLVLAVGISFLILAYLARAGKEI